MYPNRFIALLVTTLALLAMSGCSSEPEFIVVTPSPQPGSAQVTQVEPTAKPTLPRLTLSGTPTTEVPQSSQPAANQSTPTPPNIDSTGNYIAK